MSQSTQDATLRCDACNVTEAHWKRLACLAFARLSCRYAKLAQHHVGQEGLFLSQ